MEQSSQADQNQELLLQTVTDTELREILERIGHEEFNGNPLSTIQDIAEGTSADPVTIGRILGEIRKEDWEERFGLKLKDHEDRIEDLEAKEKNRPVVPPVPTVIHHYETPPYTSYGYASNTGRMSNPAKPIIGLVIFLVFMIFVVVPSCSHMGAVQVRMNDPIPGGPPWSQPRSRIIWPEGSNVSPDQKRAIERAIQKW